MEFLNSRRADWFLALVKIGGINQKNLPDGKF